jgi:hypothetical protein
MRIEDISSMIMRPFNRITSFFRHLFSPGVSGPAILGFNPIQGCPGIALEITGRNFSQKRDDNLVIVGGEKAFVVDAKPTRLKVITSYMTKTGPLEVKINGDTAWSSADFTALGWPLARDEQDGPPILITGFGSGRSAVDMPSTGDLNVLIVLCHPEGLEPPDPGALRDQIIDSYAEVRTYYQQASYGRLNLVPTVTTGWCILDRNLEDMLAPAPLEESYRPDIHPQAADYAAREALGGSPTREEKEDYLSEFTLIIAVVYINYSDSHPLHPFPRDEGSTLSYHNPDTGIDIDLDNRSSVWTYMLLDEVWAADWKVIAHETGHCMVMTPVLDVITSEFGESLGPWREAAILGEDLYPTVGAEASAAYFDLMGHHSLAALFSAYYMEQLGYYDSENIEFRSRTDTPEIDEEFLVVAHGVGENTRTDRCHLVKLRIAPELYYYIEVRQRPDPDDPGSQVFDGEISLPFGSDLDGGVVVTKVFTGLVNMNQRMRFITLMFPVMDETPQPYHPVLIEGEEVVDPARNLSIIIGEIVSDRPLTYRVRVSWSPVGGTEVPPGDIRLRITPWNADYATPDIWINRSDNDVAGHEGRRYDVDLHPELGLDPVGNRDRPRVDSRNEFWGRVHCDGPPGQNIENLIMTFYSVVPPGVGDNGNWAPLGSMGKGRRSTGESIEDYYPWYPEIGEHTCLKLHASAELPTGEKLEASAQENVFEFLDAESGSIPAPVVLPLAVRNPLDERIPVLVSVRGVPAGFVAHFPHCWVWLDPKEERELALTVIPTRDYFEYQKMEVSRATILVNGWIPRYYREEIGPGIFPPPCLFPIGGILARVTPKRKVTIQLWEDQKVSQPDKIGVEGGLTPQMGNEWVTIDLKDPVGRQQTTEVSTDSRGRFNAIFELKAQPDKTTEKKETEEPPSGVYVARALIISSPGAAPAESNTVTMRR